MIRSALVPKDRPGETAHERRADGYAENADRKKLVADETCNRTDRRERHDIAGKDGLGFVGFIRHDRPCFIRFCKNGFRTRGNAFSMLLKLVFL